MEQILSESLTHNPIITNFVTEILGPEYHIVNASFVISTAGAEDQSWHTDGPHMSVSEHLDCHCLNVFIPLVDVVRSNGPTSFRPASHYLTRNFQKMYLAAFIKKRLHPVDTPEVKKGSILLVCF